MAVVARKPTPEARVRQARTLAREAIARAQRVAAEPSAARSTRTRASYKIRSDALEQVLRVLEGRRGDG
jgi:hypothetical protein